MTEQEKKQTVRITNIQRFCLHDGPGIRTTVFLKGCSIHCPWCANPENINFEIQSWSNPTSYESGRYGCDITLETLCNKLIKDKIFYLDGGGVTFSGGEPLLQIERYEPLLKTLKMKRIHLAIETALFVDPVCIGKAFPYFDWWYVDMKILHPDRCQKVLGGCVGRYLDNLRYVAKNAVKLCVRIPCCIGMTDSSENIPYLLKALQANQIFEVELLEVHHLGDKKRASLNLSTNDVPASNRLAVERLYRKLSDAGISCKVLSV